MSMNVSIFTTILLCFAFPIDLMKTVVVAPTSFNTFSSTGVRALEFKLIVNFLSISQKFFSLSFFSIFSLFFLFLSFSLSFPLFFIKLLLGLEKNWLTEHYFIANRI